MKFFKQTITGVGENEVKTESEILEKDIKAGEVIHVCRHEEGLPCSLLKNN